MKGSIKMGFQFIQIGSFRLGADDFCLMVSQPRLQHSATFSILSLTKLVKSLSSVGGFVTCMTFLFG